MQDHKPLIEQDAVGHAVRAGYVYSAMADIARFSDAPEYEKAVERIWNDVVSRKMYVNGGVGTAQYGDEGFGDPYLLPNRTYCESCAAMAGVLWQHRMNLLKAEAKYADVMELTLYNGMLGGIAISGDAFFYQNPLESRGAERRTWIGLACCPTNFARIIPQVGGFAYATKNDDVYVNLFISGKATIALDGGKSVTLEQETAYPWDGKVKLTVAPEEASEFDPPAADSRLGSGTSHPERPLSLRRFRRAAGRPESRRREDRRHVPRPTATFVCNVFGSRAT